VSWTQNGIGVSLALRLGKSLPFPADRNVVDVAKGALGGIVFQCGVGLLLSKES
jgi:hypothetical protein